MEFPLAGRIVRDKTFFFAAYEGYRQHWVFPELGYVPSAAFRAQVAATSPALIPILNAYPIGQTPYPGNPNIAEFTSSPRQVVNEDSGMFRIDHHFSDKTTAFVRANIDEAVNTQPNGQSFGPTAAYFISRQRRNRTTAYLFSDAIERGQIRV